MANPRPLSIVKLKDPNDPQALHYDLKSNDVFVYYGELAQDPTKCLVIGINCGKRLHLLSPDLFVEITNIETGT